eukprot:TRINITY_DN1977_c0_g2_i2.p1 TRINITY_DN1977_c0_g2~~TRINITY_DN1977_c0_g2_i2.p1  ORF type:complete len:423 (+),score=138.73 TRINITY_DN1977_c0_g2_i2:168-1271(+)
MLFTARALQKTQNAFPKTNFNKVSPNLFTKSPSSIGITKSQRQISANIKTSADLSDQLFNPTPEHRQLRELVANFAKTKVDPQAAEHDREGKMNVGLLKELGQLGLLGITIPEKDGGAGMDTVAAVIVHHELSKYDPGFTLAYLAHSMLFVNNFYMGANDLQKKKYLPHVLSGDYVGGMGMTEPGAGTDVLGMSTRAVKKGNEYVLNGSKTYITNSVEGQCFLVYAKLDGKITAFLVDRTCPGFSNSQKIDKLGMRGSSMAELIFEDCRVPAENLLGQEGKGVVHMMRNLEIERVTLAAMSVGIAERAVEIMVDYAHNRKAFGASINSFGQIQKYIAEGYSLLMAAKSLTYNEARDCVPSRENRNWN